MPDHIALPMLPRALAEHSGKTAPKYRRLYNDALDGVFPAEKDGARWIVSRADLQVIAKHYGLAA